MISFTVAAGDLFSLTCLLLCQLVSVMGAGLLVGTALSVIIPEGMQTLVMAYSSKEQSLLQHK